MRELISLYKEDKALLFIALFYSIIFIIIIQLFSLVLTINIKALMLFSIILFSFFSKFLTNLSDEKLSSKTFWFVLYFSFSPIISYFSVMILLYVNDFNLIDNAFIVGILYLISMIFPYIFFLSLLIHKKYKLLIIKSIKVVRVSLSFSIAIMTILFTLAPLVVESKFVNMLYLVTLIPFSLNILLLCFIEYFQIKKEIKSDVA